MLLGPGGTWRARPTPTRDPRAPGPAAPLQKSPFRGGERFARSDLKKAVLPRLGCSCSRCACNHLRNGGTGSRAGVWTPAQNAFIARGYWCFSELSWGFAQKYLMSRVGAAGFVITAHSGNRSCCLTIVLFYFFFLFPWGTSLPCYSPTETRAILYLPPRAELMSALFVVDPATKSSWQPC